MDKNTEVEVTVVILIGFNLKRSSTKLWPWMGFESVSVGLPVRRAFFLALALAQMLPMQKRKKCVYFTEHLLRNLTLHLENVTNAVKGL